MAITVNFWQFSKRENSTARPSAEGMTSYQCNIKEPCGILTPTITMNLGFYSSPAFANYAQIPDFGRYYFVSEWTYDSGLWIATLNVDTLASWRDQIGNSSQYVLRSAAESDGNIIDNYYPTTAAVTKETYYGQNPFTDDLNDVNHYSYVLNTIAKSSYETFGSGTFVSMGPLAFRSFKKAMLTDVNYLNIDASEISANLQKALFNPYQYISSCMFFPFQILGSGPAQSVPLGWWDLSIGQNVYYITSGYDKYEFQSTIAIPKHPQSPSRGNYLNLSPYSDYLLVVEPWGQIPLDSSKLVGGVLNCNITVDIYSGVGILQLQCDGHEIGLYTSQVGVPVQIAQITQHIPTGDELLSTAVSGIVGGVQAFFSGGNVINGIQSAAQASLADARINGSVGAIAGYSIAPHITATFYPCVDESNEHMGRPLCKERVLRNIPGYTMVEDADVSFGATQTEQQIIKSYMEGGFYFA